MTAEAAQLPRPGSGDWTAEASVTLPAGLTFVSASPSKGTFDSGTGLWIVGAVTPATPQTLLIRARVTSPVAQTNVASIGQMVFSRPLQPNNELGR